MRFIEKYLTVDAIFKDFHKVIERLQHVATHHEDQADRKNAKAQLLLSQIQEHDHEASRATKLIKKVKEFIS